MSAPIYIGGALLVADDNVPRDRPIGIAWPEALVGDCTIDVNGVIVEIPPRHAKTHHVRNPRSWADAWLRKQFRPRLACAVWAEMGRRGL